MLLLKLARKSSPNQQRLRKVQTAVYTQRYLVVYMYICRQVGKVKLWSRQSVNIGICFTLFVIWISWFLHTESNHITWKRKHDFFQASLKLTYIHKSIWSPYLFWSLLYCRWGIYTGWIKLRLVAFRSRHWGCTDFQIHELHIVAHCLQ